MNKQNDRLSRFKIGLGAAMITILTGCVGYVEGGYYGSAVVVEPDLYVFGGFHERGHDVHVYSHRGYESRGAAHPGGGRGGRR